ncbi:ANK REP REGION domain-containing protein [Citrus sinensis]|nr:ANK REP REGION domain-containing protein [Citrus sinensis]
MSNELIELAKKDNIQENDGCTEMHRGPVEGDGEVVHFLGKLDPESRPVVEDNGLMTPLHRAAVNGDAGVITEIASSESLAKLTSNDETALILAVKNSQIDAFKILMKETKRHNLEHLFNATDKEGNSILHLAALNKLIVIVNLLLESSYSHKIQINSKNNQGQTALDICNANSQDSVSKEIGSILERAAAQQQSEKFDAKDVISGKLPAVVYLMVFNSAVFITTMAAITILVWPLQLRTILLFLVICTCVVYVMFVDEVTPEFSVSVGKFSVSSIALMWSLVAALCLSGISILSMRGKYTSSLWRFIVWLSMKKANWWSNNTVEDLEASSI